MYKEWKVDIKKDFKNQYAVDCAIMTIFTIRDKFFSDREVHLSGDDSWDPRSKYYIPYGISPIEAMFFFKKSNIDGLNVHSEDFKKNASITFEGNFFIDGDEEFYKNCLSIWESFKSFVPYKKINYIIDGTATVFGEVSRNDSIQILKDNIVKHNAAKNIKVLFDGAKEFVKVDSTEDIDKFIANREVDIIINYDEVSKFYGHVDFVGNSSAIYKWE